MPTMFNQCLTSAQRPASTIYNTIPPVVHVGQTFNNLPCDTHQTVVWKKIVEATETMIQRICQVMCHSLLDYGYT